MRDNRGRMPTGSNPSESLPSAATEESIFMARGVTKVYDMGEVQVHALRGVDMDLYAGELMVLLGPSGSGKSTLLNILGDWIVPPTARSNTAGWISPKPRTNS